MNRNMVAACLMGAIAMAGCRNRSPAPGKSESQRVETGASAKEPAAKERSAKEPPSHDQPSNASSADQVLASVKPPPDTQVTMATRVEREGLQQATAWCVPAATARDAIALVAESLRISGANDVEIRGSDPRWSASGSRAGVRVNARMDAAASSRCPRTSAGWPIRLTAFSEDAARVPLLPEPAPGERVDGF